MVASVPPPAGSLKPRFEKLVPDRRGGFVIAETNDFHVVQFPEGDIYGQFIGDLLHRIGKWIWRFIKWMDGSYKGALSVGHVVDIGIHWIQTCRGCVRITSIARQKKMVLQM